MYTLMQLKNQWKGDLEDRMPLLKLDLVVVREVESLKEEEAFGVTISDAFRLLV